jgi:thiol:disulfide interchange protein
MVVFAAGFGLALVVGLVAQSRLPKTSTEPDSGSKARPIGLHVAMLLILGTAVGAFLLRPLSGGPEVHWTVLRDVDHLVAEVGKAGTEGKAVVVDVGAEWCFYCKKYEEMIRDDRDLNRGFQAISRLKIDVTEDKREDLREALGIPLGQQPYMVFLDRQGRILRGADVTRWEGGKGKKELERRLKMVGSEEAPTEVVSGKAASAP